MNLVKLMSKKNELLKRLAQLEASANFAESQYQTGDRETALEQYRKVVKDAMALKDEIAKMIG